VQGGRSGGVVEEAEMVEEGRRKIIFQKNFSKGLFCGRSVLLNLALVSWNRLMLFAVRISRNKSSGKAVAGRVVGRRTFL
jgi:hypothetical protein